MKRIPATLLSFFLLLSAASLLAQVPTGYIMVSGTKIRDVSGQPEGIGTLCAQIGGTYSPYSVAVGGGQTTEPPVCVPIINGAFTINLPDTHLTTPQNACIALTATDDETGAILLQKGYNCVQPTSATGSTWCSTASGVTTCNFDNYTLNLALLALVTPGSQGPQGVPGCLLTGGSCSDALALAPAVSQTVVQSHGTTARFNSLNGVIDETLYSLANITNPALSAALSSTPAGGSVAPNTYYGRVTFVTPSGETTPSPLDSFNQYVTTTSGTTSQLLCSAQEAPAGATGFNCYIRSGVSGSFYKQGSTIPLGSIYYITSTPTTSGAVPPSIGTAGSIYQGSFVELGGAGSIVLPSTAGVASGSAGDPQAAGQTVYNHATGAVESWLIPTPMKSVLYGPTLGGVSWDMPLPDQLTLGQQAQTAFIGIHANCSPFFGGGINPQNPTAAVGLSVVAERGCSLTETIWAGLFGAAYTNHLGGSKAAEFDIFNDTGTDDDPAVGPGQAILITSLGQHKAFAGTDLYQGSGGFEHAINLENTSLGGVGIVVGTGFTAGLQMKSTLLMSAAPLIFAPADATATPMIYAPNASGNGLPRFAIDNSGDAQFLTVQAAAFRSSSTNGFVNVVGMTAQGAGYTSIPLVSFSGGGCTTFPTATAGLSSGGVGFVTLTGNGAGCTSPPAVSFSGGGGSGAVAFSILGQSLPSAGILRLAETDTLSWRNHGDSADVTIFHSYDSVNSLDYVGAANLEIRGFLSSNTLTVSGLASGSGGKAVCATPGSLLCHYRSLLDEDIAPHSGCSVWLCIGTIRTLYFARANIARSEIAGCPAECDQCAKGLFGYSETPETREERRAQSESAEGISVWNSPRYF